MKVIHIFMLLFVSHHGLGGHVNINLDLRVFFTTAFSLVAGYTPI